MKMVQRPHDIHLPIITVIGGFNMRMDTVALRCKNSMRHLLWGGVLAVLMFVASGPAISRADCPDGKVEVRVTGDGGVPKRFVTVEFLGAGQPVSVLTGAGGSVCATLGKARYAVRVIDREKVQNFSVLVGDRPVELRVKW
jgi:hypothetical protein